MRRPLFVGNWKMNKTAAETQLFIENFKSYKNDNCDIAICAPFTALHVFDGNENFKLGAQNFYPAAKGAFTGEVSLEMLKEYGVSYILIGHSERREYFHEEDAFLQEKYRFAVQEKLTPILCVGETLELRQKGEALRFCGVQVKAILENIKVEGLPNEMIIAYEPIWAIGTGYHASSDDAQEMCAHLRQIVQNLCGDCETRILYGGSVNTDNVASYMSKEDIDGALIGGASLEAESFAALITEGCVTHA